MRKEADEVITIVIYDAETMQVIAVLPLSLEVDTEEQLPVNWQILKGITYDTYDFEVYTDVEPVMSVDDDGLVRLVKNACFIDANDLK